MNALERVMNTINRKPIDYIPVYPFVNQISRTYGGYDFREWTLDPKKCAESILKMTEELDLDIMSTQMDLSLEAEDWGLKMEHPIERPPEAQGEARIQSLDDYYLIQKLDLNQTKRMSKNLKLAEYLCEAKGKEKFILGYMMAPLAILGSLRGLGDLFHDILKHPEEVHFALENISNTLADFAIALIQKGCHGIMINALYASGIFMSGKLWEKFEGIYIQKICQKIRAAGGKIFLQSTMENCRFDHLIKMGDPDVIAFLSLPKGYSTLEEVKIKYGNQVTLMGHIDPFLFSESNEREVIEECRQQIDAYKKGQGYILATGYDYPTTIGDHYAKIMINEAKSYGAF